MGCNNSAFLLWICFLRFFSVSKVFFIHARCFVVLESDWERSVAFGVDVGLNALALDVGLNVLALDVGLNVLAPARLQDKKTTLGGGRGISDDKVNSLVGQIEML